MSSITTNGSQAFNVPNNDEGRTFLRLMRKFINRPRWRYRGMGRGDRFGQRSVTQSRSKWIALYLGHGEGGGQFKQASLLSFQEDYQLWRLRNNTATLQPKKQTKGLTKEEKDYLQLILETYEQGLESPSEKESNLFYGIFQKLVDI